MRSMSHALLSVSVFLTPTDNDDNVNCCYHNSWTTTMRATTGGATTAGTGENSETSTAICTATREQQSWAARMVHPYPKKNWSRSLS